MFPFILTFSFLSPSVFCYANIENLPSVEEMQIQLWNNYVWYHNWRINDLNTINKVYASDKSIEKMVTDYMNGVQYQIWVKYQSEKSDYITAYFDSMKIAKNAYKDIQTKINKMNIPPVWSLDTLDKESLKKYVVLYVDQESLKQLIGGYFPLFNPLMISNPYNPTILNPLYWF